MDVYQKILNSLNDPEDKTFILWYENFMEKQIIRAGRAIKVVSNFDYMSWLENFTLLYPEFSDIDWEYKRDKIPQEVYNQIKKLGLLYDGISMYATQNNIHASECEFGQYYSVRYNNVGYEIGVMVGQGSLRFCNRVEIKDITNFIDFADIVNNPPYNKLGRNYKDLNYLKQIIENLHQRGVSLDYISKTVENTIQNIKLKEDVHNIPLTKRRIYGVSKKSLKA